MDRRGLQCQGVLLECVAMAFSGYKLATLAVSFSMAYLYFLVFYDRS